MPGLRQQRELRCWTVAELGRRSGVKWPTAAAADAGEEVSAETARKILLALEACPPSEIAVRLFSEGITPDAVDSEISRANHWPTGRTQPLDGRRHGR